MSHQMLNNNKDRNKETNRNCGIENTITNEEFTRRLNISFELAEEGISKLEDRSNEIILSKEQKEKRMKRSEETSEVFGKPSSIQLTHNRSPRRREMGGSKSLFKLRCH